MIEAIKAMRSGPVTDSIGSGGVVAPRALGGSTGEGAMAPRSTEVGLALKACRAMGWAPSGPRSATSLRLVDQPMKCVELVAGHPLVFQQVGDEAAHVAAEDAVEQLPRGGPLDAVFLEPGEEHEGAILGLMAHGPLGFELPQEGLHGAVSNRFGRVEGLGDFPSIGPLAVPQDLHDTENGEPVAKLARAAPCSSWPCKAGNAKETVHWMAPDFDAPLEDFKEYME
jgi:hypothetical protein